ncbi:MAG: hypothetical protein ACW98Y_11000 [Candidatus Thorarchaeota archaeon]|jgi:hypothetical protein
MRVEKLDCYDAKRTETRDVYEFVKRNISSLNRYLDYVNESLHSSSEVYIQQLISKYNEEASRNFESLGFIDYVKDEGMKLLIEHPKLIEAFVNFLLSSLEVPDDFSWEEKDQTLLRFNITKAGVHALYHRAKLLTDLMDTEVAFDLLKNYIDHTISMGSFRESNNLVEMFERDVEDARKDCWADWVAALVHDGLYASKGYKCGPYEALKDFDNPILTEICACYGDFARIKRFNPNYVLTRTQTLFNGDFCDDCVHDTRIVDNVEHPSKDFFDKF